MDGVNYYQLFSLSHDASESEVKASYRRLSMSYHPDRGGTTEQMAHLNEAYRVLSNPLLRREYDQKLVKPVPQTVHYTASSQAQGSYYYTAPRRSQATTMDMPNQDHFWRWFIVLAIMAIVFLAYDVLATWIMPSYLSQASAQDTSSSTSSTSDTPTTLGSPNTMTPNTYTAPDDNSSSSAENQSDNSSPTAVPDNTPGSSSTTSPTTSQQSQWLSHLYRRAHR